ncbi:MAG: hypothetical protein L6Q68_02345 [Aquabacterium sp.]|nr:hypothetical protein [Aquabacterium sp.]
MAIQSIDQLVSAISAGQITRYEWNKITGASAYAAGRWYDMSMLAGSPIANAWAGTALNWRACDEAAGNGTQIFGIPHGGNVSALIKHLVNLNAWSTAATGVPSNLTLVDLEGYWPGISNNTTSAQTLVGTPTLRNPNGAGCRLYWVQTSAAGATAQNIALSYTNQDGNTGNTLPVTVAMTASAIAGHMSHSGTAANNYGPFLPLASGDSGVRNVATVTFSAANTGTGALCLARPLAQISLSVAGLMTEKDLLNQIPSLPRVRDGACLVWLLGAGAAVAASTTFAGGVETVWG